MIHSWEWRNCAIAGQNSNFQLLSSSFWTALSTTTITCSSTCMIQSYRIEIEIHLILHNHLCRDVVDSNSFFPKIIWLFLRMPKRPMNRIVKKIAFLMSMLSKDFLNQIYDYYPSQHLMCVWSKLWALEVRIYDSVSQEILHKRNISNSTLHVRTTVVHRKKIAKFALWIQSVKPEVWNFYYCFAI